MNINATASRPEGNRNDCTPSIMALPRPSDRRGGSLSMHARCAGIRADGQTRVAAARCLRSAMGEGSRDLARRPQHRLRAHEFRHQDGSAARCHLAGRSRRQACAAPFRRRVEQLAALVARRRPPGLSRSGRGWHDAVVRLLERQRSHGRHQQFHRIAYRPRLVAGRTPACLYHAGARRAQTPEGGIAGSAEERQMGGAAQAHRQDGVPHGWRRILAEHLHPALHRRCRWRRRPPAHAWRLRHRRHARRSTPTGRAC